MKKITTLFIFCLISAQVSFPQSTWQLQQSPVPDDLVSLFFLDDDLGWIISSSGTLLSTSDGGTIWNVHDFPEYQFRDIHFTSPNNGCIVGWHVDSQDSSLILVTSDGGASWTEADHPKVNRLNDVYFASSTVGWAVGTYDDLDLNCCLYTSDGGVSWMMQMEVLVAGAELFGVHFRDELIGATCGADGAFLHTNSGGTTGWSFNIAMPLVDLNAMVNIGDQQGCVVGAEGTVLFTINDWYQHIVQTSGTDDDLNGVHAEPVTNKVWAVGNNGTIIHMANYLLGWIDQNSGTDQHLRDVYMHSESEGWAVGDNGTILHYTAGTFIAENPNNLHLILTPNPSDGAIKVMLDTGHYIDRIEVIDILGQVGKVVIPGEARSDISLDLSELDNGIYFIKVFTREGFALKRLIINS